jgi:hypothetical protein
MLRRIAETGANDALNRHFDKRRGGGDDDGIPPDLVARIDALEKRAASADVKLDKLADAVNGARVDLGKIEGKLSNLPTTF